MRKTAAALMAFVMILSFTACTGAAPLNADARMKIVTTIFPEYDWISNIIGSDPGKVKLSCLTDNGTDMHSYQPTTEDIMKISSCDIFVYVGGESDDWVNSVLDNAVNKDMRVLSIMDTLGSSLQEEELKEGMEDFGAEEDDEAEYDEHVWLSLRNAERICSAAADLLCEAVPENAEAYRRNLESYTEKLSRLDAKFEELAQGLDRKSVV